MITHSCSSQSTQPLHLNKSICLHSLVRFGVLPFELMMSAQIWIKHPFISVLHTRAAHPQAQWLSPHLGGSVPWWHQNMPARRMTGHRKEGHGQITSKKAAKWVRKKDRKEAWNADGWGRRAEWRGETHKDRGSFDVCWRYFDTQKRWHGSIQSPPLLGCASIGSCIQTLIDDGTCRGIRIKAKLTLPSRSQGGMLGRRRRRCTCLYGCGTKFDFSFLQFRGYSGTSLQIVLIEPLLYLVYHPFGHD